MPRQVKYITKVLAQVDIDTKSRQKQEFKIKEEKLAEIEQICKFNYRDDLNTETSEWPNPIRIMFYKSDL